MKSINKYYIDKEEKVLFHYLSEIKDYLQSLSVSELVEYNNLYIRRFKNNTICRKIEIINIKKKKIFFRFQYNNSMETVLKFIAYNKDLDFNILFEMSVKSNGMWCIAEVYRFLAERMGLDYPGICSTFHIRKYTDVLPKYAKSRPLKNLDDVEIKM